MASSGNCHVTISQPRDASPRHLESAVSWVRALLRGRCRATARDGDGGRDDRLVREDARREAALSLLLGDGVSFTGREYQLIELLWRTDP